MRPVFRSRGISILPILALASSGAAGRPRNRLAKVTAVRHGIGAEIAFTERKRGRRPVITFELANEHVGAVCREHQFREPARKARSRLDQGNQRARGQIDTLEDTLPQACDLARKPVALVRIEESLIGQHLRRIAGRREHNRRDIELVRADVENGIVELARKPQRPKLAAESSRSAVAGGASLGPRTLMAACAARG